MTKNISSMEKLTYPKKVCIMYIGAYNTFDLTYNSHKENLFDLLDELNIEYDVYISVANELTLKHPKKEFVSAAIKKLSKFTCFKDHLNEDSVKSIGHHHWYHYTKMLEHDEMSGIFTKLVGDDHIKHMDFKIKETAENVYPYSNAANIHLARHFFASNFYKRIRRVSDLVKNEGEYDKFITLRPDFYISPNILKDCLQEQWNNKNKPVFYVSYRIDYFTISNKLFYRFINFGEFNKKISW